MLTLYAIWYLYRIREFKTCRILHNIRYYNCIFDLHVSVKYSFYKIPIYKILV